jgi:hypothetical protein
MRYLSQPADGCLFDADASLLRSSMWIAIRSAWSRWRPDLIQETHYRLLQWVKVETDRDHTNWRRLRMERRHQAESGAAPPPAVDAAVRGPRRAPLHRSAAFVPRRRARSGAPEMSTRTRVCVSESVSVIEP